MSEVHQRVGAAVRAAREKAREILSLLESTGHPETSQSNSLYLALVTLQKRLLSDEPAPLATFLAELDRLARECTGRLAAVKPAIGEALRLARGAKA